MFSKRHRMTRDDFDALQAPHRRASGKGFRIALVPRKDGTSAISVVVSKKGAPKAVDRNRLRRRAYRAVAELWPQLKHPLLGALYASPKASLLSYDELRDDIKALLSRVDAFRPER